MTFYNTTNVKHAPWLVNSPSTIYPWVYSAAVRKYNDLWCSITSHCICLQQIQWLVFTLQFCPVMLDYTNIFGSKNGTLLLRVSILSFKIYGKHHSYHLKRRLRFLTTFRVHPQHNSVHRGVDLFSDVCLTANLFFFLIEHTIYFLAIHAHILQ